MTNKSVVATSFIIQPFFFISLMFAMLSPVLDSTNPKYLGFVLSNTGDNMANIREIKKNGWIMKLVATTDLFVKWTIKYHWNGPVTR